MSNDTGPDPEIISIEESADDQWRRDRDGVDSLRDTEAEVGDEEELVDLFDIDEAEAREVGADFVGGLSDEPRLD